ncbi:hypothetical protein CHS0354_023083 [Potamilus streckersoni]|uniref:Uncharacterized protein n=1 Tax=Potamilus streckersoni TaxID=2493646 RepID=A0AAE0RWV0_9BIVA|nr:hypothetical protein CHS0354_023083 [Potamilus streckersoni]
MAVPRCAFLSNSTEKLNMTTPESLLEEAAENLRVFHGFMVNLERLSKESLVRRRYWKRRNAAKHLGRGYYLLHPHDKLRSLLCGQKVITRKKIYCKEFKLRKAISLMERTAILGPSRTLMLSSNEQMNHLFYNSHRVRQRGSA